MFWNESVWEKIFVIIIIIYFVFLYRYRRRIRSSRLVLGFSFKVKKLKKYWSYRRLNFNVRRFILKVVIIFLLICTGYFAYARLNPEKRFYRLIERCNDLVKEGKQEQAIIDMTNALKIRPDYIKGHYFLAFLFRERGETDKAEAALREVIRLQIGFEDSVHMLASLLEQKRDKEGLVNLADQIAEKMPVQSKILKAKSMIMEERLDKALRILEEVKATAPDNEEAYQLAGAIYAVSEEIEKAIDEYEMAVKLDYGLWQAHYALANLYLGKNRTEEALWELNTARSLNRDFHVPALTLARLHLRNNESEKAADILERMLKEDQGNEEASFLLGNIYTGMGKFQEAINLFNRLPEQYKENKKYVYNLSLSYFNTGKYQKAVVLLDTWNKKRGLDIHGRRLLSRVHYALGNAEASSEILQSLVNKGEADYRDQDLLRRAKNEVKDILLASARKEERESRIIRTRHADLEEYLRKKDYDSLIKGANKALQENSFKAPFHNLLGVAYLATGKAEIAKRHFRLSYEEKRDNPMPLLNLIHILIKEGFLKEAEKLLSAHNLRFPEEALTRLALGKIYLMGGERKEAERLFTRAIQLDPDNFEAHQQIGLVYRLKGDLESALKEYEKAIELNPKDTISLNDAAYIYAGAEKNLDRALDYADRAAGLLPKSGTIRDTRGWIRYLRGDIGQALKDFTKAYELNPYLPVIPFHLGLAQFYLERYEEAERSLKLALNMKGQFEEAGEAEKILAEISKKRIDK